MSSLVSIVINNYNYGRYVRTAIDSALAQTYQNREVIIVDDGSTDDSRTIIAEYEKKAQIILKENGGQASAFNVGIQAAKGDFVLLLDSDDYLFPGAVETCVRLFPAGYSRIYFRLQLVDGSGKSLSQDMGDGFFRKFDGDVAAMLASGEGFFWPPTSANFFDGRKLRDVMPVPERDFRICADAFVAVQTSFLGPVRSVDKQLGAYRLHGSNNSFSATRLLSDSKRLKNRIDDYFRIPALLREAYARAGYVYDVPSADGDFSFLQMLCAAHKLNIDSAHVASLTRRDLLDRIGRYLRSARESTGKRIIRAAFLFTILALPDGIARRLLVMKDRWNGRHLSGVRDG